MITLESCTIYTAAVKHNVAKQIASIIKWTLLLPQKQLQHSWKIKVIKLKQQYKHNSYQLDDYEVQEEILIFKVKHCFMSIYFAAV